MEEVKTTDVVQVPKYPLNLRMTFNNLSEIVGREVRWEDITDHNLELLFLKLEEKYRGSTLVTISYMLKNFLKPYEDIIPSKNYRKIFVVNLGTGANNLEYLSRDELHRIYRYTPKNNAERYVRVIFLLMAFTGAKKEDVSGFTIYNINDKAGYLFYTNEKNGIDVSVPLHPLVKGLIAEKAQITDKPSTNAQNKALKNICKEVKIAGNAFDGKERFEKVTFITAQKSFATGLYDQNIKVSDIQDVMGLTSRRITIRYIIGYRMEKNKSFLPTAVRHL